MLTLQSIPAWEADDRFAQVAKLAGFCLHAGVVAQAWERPKLESPCRSLPRLMPLRHPRQSLVSFRTTHIATGLYPQLRLRIPLDARCLFIDASV